MQSIVLHVVDHVVEVTAFDPIITLPIGTNASTDLTKLIENGDENGSI